MRQDKTSTIQEDTNVSHQVLVLDDERDIGEFIDEVALSLNIPCIVVDNVNDFMEKLTPSITLIILDLVLPQLDGIEILRYLNQQNSTCEIVLMSGMDKRVLDVAEELAKSLGLSVVGRLQKPFRFADVESVLVHHSHSTSSGLNETKQDEVTYDITEQSLRQAIEKNELQVYYQPQIDLRSNTIVGVEALVRWQHPLYGLIKPNSFISVAERLEKIDEIDWYVINKSFTTFNQMIKCLGRPITLSLNMSPYSIKNLKYPDMIALLAEKNNIDPSNIMIEVTETRLFNELSTALDIFARLRMKKIKLSIDDFGTGYATLQQLRCIPANELKIDRSFIKDMLENDSARIMVLKTIEMAHDLGMSVIAEGVETLEQKQFLAEHHCDRIQGYLESEPLAIDELLEWFAKK